MRHVINRYRSGTPRAYYRTGLKNIHFHPVPDKTTAYTITTIDDLDELTLTDSSPFITDFDDFVIEYAALRLSIGNEYDMSQEAQVMANITAQIQQLLYPPPPGYETHGYWDNTCRWRTDYGDFNRCV